MNKTKHIITHSNSFHADEVTAIALLYVFTQDIYTIDRIPHQSPIPPSADFVIDIGREYDGITFFDHHQWTINPSEPDHLHNMSSAGLIWKYLNLSVQYPSISRLIRAVDQNDVGIKKSSPIEYSRIIGAYNHTDIYDSEAQLVQFNLALDVAIQLLISMKHMDCMVRHFSLINR